MDLYELLGTAPDSLPDALRAAYRRQALAEHPDHHQNSEASQARFRLLQHAWEVLGDPQRRAEYDRWRAGSPSQKAARRSRVRALPSPAPFETLLGSLLWDLEDALSERGREPLWRRAFLDLLAKLESELLEPCGLPDHFFEARQLPAPPPATWAAILAGEARRPAHFPFSGAQDWFADATKRLHRLLARPRFSPAEQEALLNMQDRLIAWLAKARSLSE